MIELQLIILEDIVVKYGGFQFDVIEVYSVIFQNVYLISTRSLSILASLTFIFSERQRWDYHTLIKRKD